MTITEAIHQILKLGYSADELLEDGVDTQTVTTAVDLIEAHPRASSVDHIPAHLRD